MNILLPDVLDTSDNIEREVFGSNASIVFGKSTKSEDISDEIWSNCDAVLAWDVMKFDALLIRKLKKCKVIVRVGAGFDNVDLVETKKNNIVVCNVPDYGTEEVADHTIALLLYLVRGLQEYTNRIRRKDWNRRNPMVFRLDKRVMGIIGLGRIGTATAMRAKAFGMQIIFYDPYVKDGYDKALSIKRVDSLKDIAGIADVISIHTPLTTETLGMISDEFFACVKKNPILINTARGPIVDISALERAMKKGVIKAAGLDVLSIEPSDSSQKIIVDYENDTEWLSGRLIVTPHCAFYSSESIVELRRKACLEALRVLKGERARNCVNNFYG